MINIKKSKKNIKILLGMSGGIDSTVAAYLFKKQGYNVIGITLKLWDNGSRCCDIEEIHRARQFSHHIGIPHYMLDFRKEFKKSVVDYFILEYLNGRTPNPCVICNEKIKFVRMLDKTRLFGGDYAATGHYARIVKNLDGIFISKAKDNKKSQEYFLARIKKENLKKIIFPLEDLTKTEVRKIAEEIDFPMMTRESQEVCFIRPDQKYYEFIIDSIKEAKDFTARIIDKNNRVLGSAECYFKYTIGQRGGLGIGGGTPNYVLNINAKNHSILIGNKQEVYRTSFFVNNVYWFTKKIITKLKVKIRYNHKEDDAVIEGKGDRMRVVFSHPQYAITPGQLAVFYEGDLVIGSGWIEEVI